VARRDRQTTRDVCTAFFACFLTFTHRFFAAFTIAALPVADRTRFFTPLKGDWRKDFLAATAKQNLTERAATESNNKKGYLNG
jgi:hypothetical protein